MLFALSRIMKYVCGVRLKVDSPSKNNTFIKI